VFVPRLSEQSFVTQFKLFFDHQKKERKKERKKEVVPIPITPFSELCSVNIDRNKAHVILGLYISSKLVCTKLIQCCLVGLFQEHLHPYSAFGLATIFLPSKIT
jgi:hypothetical protein